MPAATKGIRNDIPLPERWGQPRSALGKVLSTMKPGDSFLTKAPRNTVYSHARYYGIKVTVRTTEDGLRVWRVN